MSTEGAINPKAVSFSARQKRWRTAILNALYISLPVPELAHLIGDYSDFKCETSLVINGKFDSATISGGQWAYVSDYLPSDTYKSLYRRLITNPLGCDGSLEENYARLDAHRGTHKMCILPSNPRLIYLAYNHAIYCIMANEPVGTGGSAASGTNSTDLMYVNHLRESKKGGTVIASATISTDLMYLNGGGFHNLQSKNTGGTQTAGISRLRCIERKGEAEELFGPIDDIVASLDGKSLFVTDYDQKQRIRRIDLSVPVDHESSSILSIIRSQDDKLYNVTTEIEASSGARFGGYNLLVIDPSALAPNELYSTPVILAPSDSGNVLTTGLIRVEGPNGENGRRNFRDVGIDWKGESILMQSLVCDRNGTLFTINALTQRFYAINPKTGEVECLGCMDISKSSGKIAAACDEKEPLMWFCVLDGPLYRTPLPT